MKKKIPSYQVTRENIFKAKKLLSINDIFSYLEIYNKFF